MMTRRWTVRARPWRRHPSSICRIVSSLKGIWELIAFGTLLQSGWAVNWILAHELIEPDESIPYVGIQLRNGPF
jgi:hypothetical protein